MTQARNLSLFADNVSSSGTVAVSGINATGTPSSSTYLRGDGSWTTAGSPPGGSTTQVQYNNAGAFGGITGATTNGTALTLVAPILGTPASVTLTNATGLPIATGLSGLTTNGVAYASSTSALTTGSALTFTGTNLGIGTSSPAAILHTSISGSGEVGRFATTTDSTPFISIYSNGSIRAKLRASTAETALLTQGSTPLLLGTNDTEAVRITTAGLVGIGTSSPSYKTQITTASTNGSVTALGLENPQTAASSNLNATVDLRFNLSGSGAALIRAGKDSDFTTDANVDGNLQFYTNKDNQFAISAPVERMRINSNGNVLIGNTAPLTAISYYKTYVQGGTAVGTNSTALADQSCGLYLYDNEGGNSNNEGAQNALVIAVNQGGAVTPANFMTCYSTYPTASRQFQITVNGNVYNSGGVYGTLSDQKVKQDIVDASSQWQDIKNVRVRKYRLKSEVERNENAPSFIGVVAQELELTSPNLVDSPEGCETDENVFKTVKTSVLQMKALKALQEAMARIETLETTITAQSATITSLTDRITALENK